MPLKAALSKIKATLSEQALDYLASFPAISTTRPQVMATTPKVRRDRHAVCRDRGSQGGAHDISITTRNRAPNRDIYPYTLVRHKGSLYLIALAVEHEAIRRYKVDRIAAAEVTSFVFERPADFDTSVYLADSFGIHRGQDEITVVVKFAFSGRPAIRMTNRSGTRARFLAAAQRRIAAGPLSTLLDG